MMKLLNAAAHNRLSRGLFTPTRPLGRSPERPELKPERLERRRRVSTGKHPVVVSSCVRLSRRDTRGNWERTELGGVFAGAFGATIHLSSRSPIVPPREGCARPASIVRRAGRPTCGDLGAAARDSNLARGRRARSSSWPANEFLAPAILSASLPASRGLTSEPTAFS